MRIAFIILLALILPVAAGAQIVQLVKGTVTDRESHIALQGVTISVTDITPVIGTVTDSNGNFQLNNVPVGKHTLHLNYPGYQAITMQNVLVTSGKEVVLPIDLEESAATKLQDVTVKSKREHINEMAIVSARTFDVQEAERYAGSRADPARMASNFAGVQGTDDSRNDIIVRGNSPQGILWRLEDIDIPNPNHFADPGSTGGPVTMLNTHSLANSDFFTGAFPAEYGNATAGVFDLKMRNGNNERYEFTAQLGFLGTELAGEGPISKKNGSSFLFTYRYSTLKLFEGLHIKIGTNSIPNYQDASLKLNFPIGKKSNFAIFGLGGLSKIDLIVSDQSSPPDELYGESDRDQYYHSNTGIIGASFSHTFNASAYTKITVAETGSDIGAHHDFVFRDADYKVDSLKDILGFGFKTGTTTAHWYVNKKFSAKHTLRIGVLNTLYALNLIDSSRQYPPARPDWQDRLNFRGNTDLIQAYIQYKYRPSDALTLTAGVHAQYLTHNSSKALEPRLGLRYRLSNADVLTFGTGLHSQMMPLYQYFTHLPQYPASQMHNYNIDFTRSFHLVAGYERRITNDLHIHVETYYQYLYDVPVEIRPGSSFSGIDQGSTFDRLFPDTLKNGGTGYNYGLELTVEKTFSHGYYVMFTSSVFDSKAKGNDGVYRNTDYNGRYTFNLLGGYEKKLGKNSTLITGAKVTYSGGTLYSPPDVAASNAKGDLVIIDSERNTLRFRDYFRTDLKLGVRINARRLTHEIALDLVNVFNTKNLLSITYSSDLATQGKYPFYEQYQLGFLPLFYYKIDFGIKPKG
ncbi:TonB-dependent receptor [Chitinophagaceae bacterium MMS25-I14]